MSSKRHKRKIQRVTQEDCVVRWDDGKENIVYKNEIENVEPGKPIHIGSRIQMCYKKKLYYGSVIEMESETNGEVAKPPTDETSSEDDKSNDPEVAKPPTDETSTEDNKSDDLEVAKPPTDETSSEDNKSDDPEVAKPPTDETSTEDDKFNDPDYQNPSCEVVGCSNEVWAGCTNQGGNCLAFMCNEHFLTCSGLDCYNEHRPKKNEYSYQQPKHHDDDLIIEEINQLRGQRSVGIQENPKMTDGCSQTSDHDTVLTSRGELGYVIPPKEHIGQALTTSIFATVDEMDQTAVANKADISTIESVTMAEITDCSSMTPLDERKSGKTKEKEGKSKCYFCIYCKKLVKNFARHIITHHTCEEDVKKIINIPKGSAKRKELLDAVRGRGALYYNTTPELNEGEIIVKRRKKNFGNGYIPCPHCKNFFKKGNLHRHYKACVKTTSKVPRNLQAASLALTIPKKIKGEMVDWLKNEVLPGISNKDRVRDRIMQDPLLIDFGNYLCTRHRTNKHLTNMVRQKLRQMAKLLLIMKRLDPEVTCLEDALTPSKYDVFMKGVNEAAGYNEVDASFRAPSVVTALGLSTQECANILQRQAIKSEDISLQNRALNWLKLYKHEFYYGIGKSAINEAAKSQWSKPRLLPTTSDVMKLNTYLKNTVKSAKKVLREKFILGAFKDLNKCVMLEIVIFNRKRIGEVEKLLISDYNKKHNIQKGTEIYNTLTATEKIVASRFQRMEVRGKLGRPVSLLINKEQVENIELILSLRNKANVPDENPYVFGCRRKDYYPASPALRTAAWNCGASKPKALTGTSLRKEMATLLQAMGLTENDLSILADFMGHNITTHRNFYRLPNEVTHLARISQVLLSLEDGTFVKYKGKRLSEIDIDVELDVGELEPPQEDNDPDQPDQVLTAQPVSQGRLPGELQSKTTLKELPDSMPSPKRSKKIETTPVKKKTYKKKSWKTPERHVARVVFAQNLGTGRLPSAMECLIAIRTHQELKDRTVEQLKAWVNNEINRIKRS